MDGSFISFAALVSPIFTPLGFSTFEIVLTGTLTTICGLIAAITSGILVKKYHVHRWMLRISCFGTTLCLLFTFISFPTRNFPLILVNTILLGIFLLPIIPIGLNFSQELTYPIEPSVINGLLMMSAFTCAFFFGLIGSFISIAGSVWVTFFLGAFCSVSAIVSIFID